MESLHLVPDMADSASALDDLAEHGERRHSVQRVLTDLPEEQRQVLELRLAGLTGPEIAAALGRSHSAIRTTQCRALAHVRRLLGVASPIAERGRHGA
jgi:RNA polymerase sigma-70 factor (ECF subfamily)